jgi:hypothetical protein
MEQKIVCLECGEENSLFTQFPTTSSICTNCSARLAVTPAVIYAVVGYVWLVRLSKIGLFVMYCLSVFQAYRGQGSFWFLTLIPLVGQLIWAGVLVREHDFFNSFFLILVISMALSLIAEVVAKRYRILH